MDNADANADLIQQGQLFAQRDQPIVILGNFAGKLDDKSLPFEPLNVGQRFAQKVEPQLVIN